MADLTVLSYLQARALLQARKEGASTATISLDLGLTSDQVVLQSDRVILADGQWLSWGWIEKISTNETACFRVEGSQPTKIQQFSNYLNRFYSLLPTVQAPTLLVSGIPMHRIKGTDPLQDTHLKIRSIAPLAGRVLDTCTGLGYTAVAAARTAEQVVTVELDPAVLEIARQNPWSMPLFADSCIQQIVGDVFEVIQDFEAETFSRVVHDPPMFSLAGDLYSGQFYRHLFRVLRCRGRLFHYIGDLDSRSGRNVVRGVARRLEEAGFVRIIRRPAAFGVVAFK